MTRPDSSPIELWNDRVDALSRDDSSRGLGTAIEASHGGNEKREEQSKVYVEGLRRYLIVAALSILLFITTLEIPIVVTALIGITSQLGGFNKVSWVPAAYLLGYAGVLIVYAKLSDIFGRKSFLLLAVFLFVVFSAACGAAQTIEELIVFRALQGLGGAGHYAICTTILTEIVPPNLYAKYTSIVSGIFSLSLLLGPIFGGAFTQNDTWRWVFLVNIPPGVLAAGLIVLCLPNGFPNHNRHNRRIQGSGIFSETIRRVDFVGSGLLLVATVLLVAALEEADNQYPWRSTYVITLLVISGISWVVLLLWERHITIHAFTQEPVLPWYFIYDRVRLGMLVNALFLGAPWFVTIFQLPQRLQLINSLSPLQAGIKLIPFTLASPIGSILAPTICKAAKIPPIYFCLGASVLQIVGLALLSTLPATEDVAAAQYGYEWIAGMGCGISHSLLMLLVPFVVSEKDRAVGMGSVLQFRVMGGAIGLAIVTSVFNGSVFSSLSSFLSANEIALLSQSAASISSLPTPQLQSLARSAFADGYNLQLKILAGFAAGQIPGTLLMWQKKQVTV